MLPVKLAHLVYYHVRNPHAAAAGSGPPRQAGFLHQTVVKVCRTQLRQQVFFLVLAAHASLMSRLSVTGAYARWLAGR